MTKPQFSRGERPKKDNDLDSTIVTFQQWAI